jgi:hypothetical protein
MKFKYLIILSLCTFSLQGLSVVDNELEQIKDAVITSITNSNEVGYVQSLEDLENVDGLTEQEKSTVVLNILADVGTPPITLDFSQGLETALANIPTAQSTASNLGAGAQVLNQGAASLQFRTLVATSPVTITQGSNTITIGSTAEANTGANIGSGQGIYAGKSGTALQFYSLSAGNNIGSLTPSGANVITLGTTTSVVNAVSSLGGTYPIYTTTVGGTGTALNVQGLNAGKNITISSGTGVTINVDSSTTSITSALSNTSAAPPSFTLTRMGKLVNMMSGINVVSSAVITANNTYYLITAPGAIPSAYLPLGGFFVPYILLILSGTNAGTYSAMLQIGGDGSITFFLAGFNLGIGDTVSIGNLSLTWQTA